MERHHQAGGDQFPVVGPRFVGDFHPLMRKATTEQGQGGIGQGNSFGHGLVPPGRDSTAIRSTWGGGFPPPFRRASQYGFFSSASHISRFSIRCNPVSEN
jgi:hypothetical protein